MGKDKTKKKRAGPLFSKTGATPPPVKKEKNDPVPVKKDTKSVLIMKKLPPPVFKDGRWTDDEDEEEKAEEIEINVATSSPKKKEEKKAEKKIKKNPVPSKKEAVVTNAKKTRESVKKDTNGDFVLKKLPPPVFKDGRWTDDEDEEEKAEEIPLQATNMETNKSTKNMKEEQGDSSFSEESNDSFDDYFPSAKSEDEEKKEQKEAKKSTTIIDDKEMEGSIPGYKLAKYAVSASRRLKAKKQDADGEESRLKYVYKDSPGGPKNIYCSLCSKYFNHTPGHKENFAHHLLDVHATQEGEKMHCKECNYVGKNMKIFQKHFKVHRSLPKPQICETCGKTYTTYSQFRRHQRKRCINDSGKSRSSEPPGTNVKHSKSPKEKRQFTCEICSKTVLSLKSLELHIANIHERRGRECRYCSKLIPYDIWEEHKQMEKEKHGINKPVVCDICGATLASKISAAQHRRNFHRPDHPDWHCDICGKTFKQSTALSVHKKNNHGEKKFQCAYCEYREVYRHLIIVHIRRKHKIPKEEIPDDAVIEHAEGPRKDQEIKDESSPYFQKKKAKLLHDMLLVEQQLQQQNPFEIKDESMSNM